MWTKRQKHTKQKAKTWNASEQKQQQNTHSIDLPKETEQKKACENYGKF